MMKLITKKIIAREFLLLTVCITVGLLTFVGTYFYNLYFTNKKDDIENRIKTTSQKIDTLLEYQNKPKIINYNSGNGFPIFKIENELTYLKNSDKTKLVDSLQKFRKSNKSKSEMESFIAKFKKNNSIRFDTVYYTKNINSGYVAKNRLINSGLSETQIEKSLDSGLLVETGGLVNYYANELVLIGNIKNPYRYLENQEKLWSLQEEINVLYTKYTYSNSKILSFENRLKSTITMLLFSGILLFLVRYLFYGIIWSLKTMKQSDN